MHEAADRGTARGGGEMAQDDLEATNAQLADREGGKCNGRTRTAFPRGPVMRFIKGSEWVSASILRTKAYNAGRKMPDD